MQLSTGLRIDILFSIYIVGATVLLLTSLPIALRHGVGLPGLVVAMLAISCGVGGVKATVAPFLGKDCCLEENKHFLYYELTATRSRAMYR